MYETKDTCDSIPQDSLQRSQAEVVSFAETEGATRTGRKNALISDLTTIIDRNTTLETELNESKERNAVLKSELTERDAAHQVELAERDEHIKSLEHIKRLISELATVNAAFAAESATKAVADEALASEQMKNRRLAHDLQRAFRDLNSEKRGAKSAAGIRARMASEQEEREAAERERKAAEEHRVRPKSRKDLIRMALFCKATAELEDIDSILEKPANVNRKSFQRLVNQSLDDVTRRAAFSMNIELRRAGIDPDKDLYIHLNREARRVADSLKIDFRRAGIDSEKGLYISSL